MKSFFQGLLLGFAVILPGISGGTAFIILGLYDQVLTDLASLRIKPYLIFSLGTATGLFLWALFFQQLLTSYPPLLFSFLLGALWASAPLVLKYSRQTLGGFSWKKPVYLLAGALVGWLVAVEPFAKLTLKNTESLVVLFLAGAISSATMLIPGISGSAVLLILGLYEDILHILRYVQLLPLAVFSIGCIVGIVGLAKVLLLFFRRFQTFSGFFTAGLILGSGRTLFPSEISPAVILAAICGALTVSLWGGKVKAPSSGDIPFSS